MHSIISSMLGESWTSCLALNPSFQYSTLFQLWRFMQYSLRTFFFFFWVFAYKVTSLQKAVSGLYPVPYLQKAFTTSQDMCFKSFCQWHVVSTEPCLCWDLKQTGRRTHCSICKLLLFKMQLLHVNVKFYGNLIQFLGYFFPLRCV